MKVLVLSCSTGGGHNAAARAIAEQFAKLGIWCEMRDALGFASPRAAKIVSKTYSRVVTTVPGAFGATYRFAEAIGSPRYKSPIYYGNIPYAGAIYEYIRKEKINAVVMPHLFPAEIMTHIARKYGRGPKTYLVSTDYSCCPFFEETEVDRFFIPHACLLPEFVRRGIPEEKITVTGIPVSEKYQTRGDMQKARLALDLPAQGRAALLMTGSMGFGNAGDLIAPLLARLGEADFIVAIGGKNQALIESLQKRFAGEARLFLLGFTDLVDRYMDACDVLFTKPGGLTTTEAAAKGVPLVHTNPIPGCETLNMRFFGKFGMSVSGKTLQETAEAGVRLMRDESACQKMIRRQREQINPRAAFDICTHVLADFR